MSDPAVSEAPQEEVKAAEGDVAMADANGDDAGAGAAPAAAAAAAGDGQLSDIGLYGLGVMGQNLALNIAEHGFRISVCNRSDGRVDTTTERAAAENLSANVVGFKSDGGKNLGDFVQSLAKPRRIIFLVKAGQAVDDCIEAFRNHLEEDDILIDGGNEWFENSIKRAKDLDGTGIQYVAMGVSGGEVGARTGPSLMPGGPKKAYDALEPILRKIAAQDEGKGLEPCVTYCGGDGAGNYVKMVHNGIEYGDMQLIAEVYEVMKVCAQLNNDEMAKKFEEWNSSELESYLIEITSKILAKKDEDVILFSDGSPLPKGEGHLVDKILDKTGNKGTGKMTVIQGADQSVPIPTIAAALDARFVSASKDERVKASEVLRGPQEIPQLDRSQLLDDLKQALYASKICSYAQGLNLIRAASDAMEWNVDLGECARIWKGGCIIRAEMLDRIKNAYTKDAALPSLLLDDEFSKEVVSRQPSWRRIVSLCVACGIPCPAMAASLTYFDQYRRKSLPSNLLQAQRDFFGSHTFERVDQPAGQWYHCKWTDEHA